MKPRSTVRNPRALLYKRFTDINTSNSLNAVYKTTDSRYWLFIRDGFKEIEFDDKTTVTTISAFRDNPSSAIATNCYRYNNGWIKYIYITRAQSDDYVFDSPGTGIYETKDGKKWQFSSDTRAFVAVSQSSTTTVTVTDKNAYYYGSTLFTYGTAWNNDTIEDYEEGAIYKTADRKYWTFDGEFIELTDLNLPIEVYATTALRYLKKYYKYNNGWQESEISSSDEVLSARYSNIGKYQTNRYYFVGSFDYMIKGDVNGTTVQYIKGNIAPLTSVNIKHYNDDIELTTDDLVVIDERVFSVENPSTSYKLMPKRFAIHFATLNSIL